jgi:hypothetical protein
MTMIVGAAALHVGGLAPGTIAMSRHAPGICWKTSTFSVFAVLSLARPGLGSELAVPKAPVWLARAGSTPAKMVPAAKSAPAAPVPSSGSPAAQEVRIQCDDDPDCGEAVQRALNQSDGKQYEAALKTYQAVYERWPTPWLLINLGRVQQKMGSPAEAVTTYERYLTIATTDKPERVKVARAFLAQAKQEIEVQRYKKMLEDAKAKERPSYKKWWFWAAIGGSVVAAAAITAGVVVGTRSSLPPERMLAENHLTFEF